MGAVAGAVSSREGPDVSSCVLRMLRAMRHRGSEAYLVFNRKISSVESWSELSLNSHTKAALGINYFPERGRVYEDSDGRSIIGVCGVPARRRIMTDIDLPEPIWHALPTDDGLSSVLLKTAEDFCDRFSAGGLRGDAVCAIRDPLGQSPLFYGKSSQIVAFASEHRALESIGISSIASVPPGWILLAEESEVLVSPGMSLERPDPLELGMDAAASLLLGALGGSTSHLLSGMKCSAIAFSGGLDSVLLARLSDSLGVRPRAYVSGTDRSHDLTAAESAASELGYDLTVTRIDRGILESALDEVLVATGSTDPLFVSIALPLYVTARAAKAEGFDRIVLGQGSDEMFGGYYRYRRILSDGGYESLTDALWSDLLSLHEVGLLRDDAVCMAHSTEPLYPFLGVEVVSVATRIPAVLKVSDPEDDLRKRVLRKAGEALDLSSEIIYRKKKAIQYGSGVDRALRDLMRREGHRDLRDFLMNRAREISR